MKSRILVISSSQMNMMMLVNKIPHAGETVSEQFYDYIPGGKGASSAVALSRLGGDCVFCTRLGDDSNGAKLRQFYNESGIDTRFIVTDRMAKTGLAVVIVEENGSNRKISYPGASDKLSVDDVEEAFTCYPDAVYLQMELPKKVIIAATRYAAEQRIPVFVDAGHAIPDFPLEELDEVEIFAPNEQDTLAYTGVNPTNMENCLKAAMALATRVSAKYYIIKLGGRGAFIYDGKYYQILPTYDAEVVDTAAAGDAFTAALTIDYLKYGDIKHACEFANAVGTITVSHAGALESIPTLHEVRDYIVKYQLPIKL